MGLIDLGRIGQRLCEVATDLGIGVFLTPAAYDIQTCELLGITEADRVLIYVFAFGVKSPQATQQRAAL